MSEENVSLPVAQALASALEKIEEYVPTEYVDLSEPDIDAEHLNHSEQGIMRVTNLLNAAVDVIQGQQEQIEEAEKKISNTETKLGTGALPSGMNDVISGLTTLNSNIVSPSSDTGVYMDMFGHVDLSVIVTVDYAGNLTTIKTIESKYRPKSQKMFVGKATVNGNVVPCTFYLYTNGEIKAYTGTAAANSVAFVCCGGYSIQ